MWDEGVKTRQGEERKGSEAASPALTKEPCPPEAGEQEFLGSTGRERPRETRDQ